MIEIVRFSASAQLSYTFVAIEYFILISPGGSCRCPQPFHRKNEGNVERTKQK